MNLFQLVVIGALVTLFGGAGYYVVEADKAGILGKSVSGNQIKPSEEQILAVSGEYICTPSQGCKNDYTLILNEDGRGELAITYEDGAEVLSETGNWVLGKRGYITLDLLEDQSGPFEIPKTILIRSVGTSTLSRIVYSAKQYQDMINPIFVKKNP